MSKKTLLLGVSAAAAAFALTTLLQKKLASPDDALGGTDIGADLDGVLHQRRKVLILGATSAIAEATARLFAQTGDDLFLVARDSEKLAVIATDLQVRGAGIVETATLDLNEFQSHQALLDQAIAALGGLDTALLAYGTLGNQPAAEADADVMRQELKTNFVSAAGLLTLIANLFEAQGFGDIAVISSVAGDRGRGSNYVYGSAKAGLTAFTQGLRNRLADKGVHVLTIKPGFVDTPMTAHIEKNGLFVGPDVIAEGIYKGLQRKQDVVYLPCFWAFIMLIIRHVPEPIFKRLSL